MFDYGYDWNFQNIERTKKAKEKKKGKIYFPNSSFYCSKDKR